MKTRSNDLLETRGQDFVFPKDFGNDIVFDYKHVHGETHRVRSVVQLDPDKLRDCKLDTYDFAYSFGAVHHYAKLKLGYVHYVWAANGKPYTSSIGNYETGIPADLSIDEVEIMRPVDKRDLKHDKDTAEMRGDSLYGRMRPGDWTHGFWGEEEAKAAAIKFFKEHFGPGWRLVADSWVEDDQPVYATT